MHRVWDLKALAGMLSALFIGAAACTTPAAAPTQPTVAPPAPPATQSTAVPAAPTAAAKPTIVPTTAPVAAKPAAPTTAPATKPATPAKPAANAPSLKIASPKEGDKLTSTDIPVQVNVSNFKLSPLGAGLPDKDGEGHIHVMLDGMTMGVLFNFYTSPNFTLPGEGIKPGSHTLIFDLASNTHMDMEDTVQKVQIDYEPTTLKPAPAPAATAATPEMKLTTPADGATVGPKFQLQVTPSNFTPSLDLEGKPNLKGFGHYHVFVDMDMASMMNGTPGGMMSMAGMVGMPGSNTINLDLSAWKDGKHTIVVEPVQNDHTPIPGAKPAMIAINLQGAAGK
jgi:hypothetical protein